MVSLSVGGWDHFVEALAMPRSAARKAQQDAWNGKHSWKADGRKEKRTGRKRQDKRTNRKQPPLRCNGVPKPVRTNGPPQQGLVLG